jgi:RNA polymerase sigma factor (sigma-70 family)
MAHQRQAMLEEPRLVRSAEDRLLNRSLLLAVIAQLSERESQILAYQIIDGLSHKEIAQLLEVSEKTVQRDCLALQRKLVALRSAAYE